MSATAVDGGYGFGPQHWARLSMAAALSVALHAAMLLGLNPARAPAGAPSPGAGVLIARLVEAVPPQASPAATLAPRREEKPAPPPAAAPGPRPSSGIELRDLPAPPHYYTSSELDQRPAPLGDVLPVFPPRAAARNGRVRVRVLINEHGVPDEVTVVRAEPEGVFDASAIAAFGQARYSPGLLKGVAVKSQLLLEVEYADPTPANARFGARRGGY